MPSQRNSEKQPPAEGLLAIVQNRIQTDLLEKCCSKWEKWMVMILDESSMRIISSAIGMYTLMEARIKTVEHISKKRAPYRESAPIYFLAPTEDSVNRLIADWTPSGDFKLPLYADSIFLYFTSKLPDELFAKIKNCKPLVKRLKAFVEVGIDFLPKEARAFHLDMNTIFTDLFQKNEGNTKTLVAINQIADKLVTVCASLNEFPHIRYRASSLLATSLAKIFHQKITQFISTNESWWYHGDGQHTEKGRCTLMILSRIDDFLSPLMHEFTYQAMVYDLLKPKDDIITYKAETSAKETGKTSVTVDKDAILNENDTVWIELRTKHIADVIQILSTRIRAIVNSSTGVTLNTKGDDNAGLTLNQMANALRALPEYKEVMSKLSQHMHMSHQCMDILNKDSLVDLSDLEQTLATGKTEEGRVPKVSELVHLVEEELNQRNDSYTSLRLLLILVVSQRGLRAEDQGGLYMAANLDPSQLKILKNLEKIGIPLVHQEQRKLKEIIRGKRVVAAKEENDSEYSSSRYVCNLKETLQKMQDGTLSIQEYPSVQPMPDLDDTGRNSRNAPSVRQNVRQSARQGKSNKSDKFRKPKFSGKDSVKKQFSGSRHIVFIAGGMCHSEVRCAQELMDKGGPEIILGSTRFISPSQLMDDLATL